MKNCADIQKQCLITYLFIFLLMQLAAVAALCVQYEAEFRPNMSIVVKALQPLLKAQASAAAPES